MFLLIISVHFLGIIVVERIQVGLCKVFFFSLLLTKHLGLQLTPLTTVCIFVCSPFSTLPFWSSVLWLISPIASPLLIPVSSERDGGLATGWRQACLQEKLQAQNNTYLEFEKSSSIKKLSLFFFSNNSFKVPVLQILHSRTEVRRVASCREGASYRETRLFVFP